MSKFNAGSLRAFLADRRAFYALLFTAMLLKFFPYGVTYFRYSDDYNAYGIFHLKLYDTFRSVFLHYKLYAARPLVGFLDAYVIARLWNSLWFVLFCTIVLHFLTIIMLDEIFAECKITWGRVAALCFGLYPLLAEASYWISASSRIVVGAFFATASVFFLCRYLARERRLELILSIVCGFIAQGFYEQIITFCFAFLILVLWINRVRIKQRFLYALPFVYAAAIGVHYYVFRNIGPLGKRASLSEQSLLGQVVDICKKIFVLFTKEQSYCLSSLWNVELPRIISENFILVACVGLLSILLAMSAVLEEECCEDTGVGPETRVKLFSSAAMAAVLFIASFGPFFILNGVHLSLRSIYIGVLAFGIVLQIFRCVCVRGRATGIIVGVLIFGLTFWSMLINIAEVNAFRVNERSDRTLAENVLSVLEPLDTQDTRIWLFGVRHQYEQHGGVHLQSSMLSDWAAQGMLNTLGSEAAGTIKVYDINPVVTGWAYDLDLAPDDILLGVTSDMQVWQLHYDNGILYSDETEFGRLTTGSGGVFTWE